MISKTFALLLLNFAASLALAAGPFDYKGLPLGTSLEDFQKAQPTFKCNREPGQLTYCVSRNSTYAQQPIMHATAEFIDDKLANIYLILPQDATESAAIINAALRAKYGKPDHGDVNKIVTRFTWIEKGSKLEWLATSYEGKANIAVTLQIDDFDTRRLRATQKGAMADL
ncbi:hypothetical protein [Roseateles microcysteis]|uniref:hypothetical protein n=1 Tax=Roseateles microcysteis TaxID=3119057 RepID=UPI002FE608E1